MAKTSIKVKFHLSSIHNRQGYIYIQIIHNRRANQISTNYQIYENEWDSKRSVILIPANSIRWQYLTNLRQLLNTDINLLKRVINRLDQSDKTYEADDIIAEYHRIVNEHSFFNFMETVVAKLCEMRRKRTCEIYRTALNSYSKFRCGQDILLDNITSDEMLRYEAYLTNRGLCPNTTSFYMRILRATFNRAVEEGIVEQNHPFKHVYTGVDKTVKRAIRLSDIKQVKQLDLSQRPALSIARDIFLFSFYTRGMTFVDIVYLRKSNLRGNVITYRRHKTKRLLTIKVEKCAREIIDRYSSSTSDYIFPIIKTIGDEYREYKNALRLVNQKLKIIGSMVGVPIRLTTYVSRHSWGSAAKTSNIPISVISESMGHDNETTTQIYLASLDASIIDQANAQILKQLQ